MKQYFKVIQELSNAEEYIFLIEWDQQIRRKNLEKRRKMTGTSQIDFIWNVYGNEANNLSILVSSEGHLTVFFVCFSDDATKDLPDPSPIPNVSGYLHCLTCVSSESKLTKPETRLERLDAWLERLDTRLERLKTQIERLETRFKRLKTLLERLDTRLNPWSSILENFEDRE